MQAVRAEGRRGAALPLVPTDDTGAADDAGLGPVDISEQAVAAVVRYAADTVDGVRARSCRVIADPADPLGLRIEMTVACATAQGPSRLSRQRARPYRISAPGSGRSPGRRGGRARRRRVARGVRTVVSTSGISQPGGGFDDPRPVTEIRIAAVAAGAARAVPGVAHLQPGLWGLVQQTRHRSVDPGHRQAPALHRRGRGTRSA